MNQVKETITADRLNEIAENHEEKKRGKVLLWILAVIGAVVAVAGIAYAIYRFLSPDDLEDFEEDLEDNFDDDFFEDEDIFEEEEKSGTEEK